MSTVSHSSVRERAAVGVLVVSIIVVFWSLIVMVGVGSSFVSAGSGYYVAESVSSDSVGSETVVDVSGKEQFGVATVYSTGDEVSVESGSVVVSESGSYYRARSVSGVEMVSVYGFVIGSVACLFAGGWLMRGGDVEDLSG